MKTIKKMEKIKDIDRMILFIIIHNNKEDQDKTEAINLIIIDKVLDLILLKKIVKYFYIR